MTIEELQSVLPVDIDGNIQLKKKPMIVVSAKDFLEIAGFENCEPTKEAMLLFDGGKKGYKNFIENNFIN